MENSKSKNESASSSISNFCIACGTTQRAVVFVPCAHYIACVPCGHGMIVCPMCQSEIKACVRLYE